MPEKEELLTVHRYLSGEMDQKEKQEFEKRMLEDPGLMALKTEVEAIWNAALGHAVPEFDAGRAFGRLHARKNASSRTYRLYRRMAAAAIVISLVSIGIALLQSGRQTMDYVHADDVVEKTLSDGSVITLREGAEMRVPETFGGVRQVELVQGEALFDVAGDVSRPFVISHPWAEVRVIGTVFTISVDTVARSYTLKVMEGEVLFTPHLSGGAIPVRAGNGFRFAVDTRIAEPFKNIDENAMSWKTGLLRFDNCLVSKVVADLQAHYMVDIALADLSVGNCRFTAPLPYRDALLLDILNALSGALGMKVSTAGAGRYVLEGGTCK